MCEKDIADALLCCKGRLVHIASRELSKVVEYFFTISLGIVTFWLAKNIVHVLKLICSSLNFYLKLLVLSHQSAFLGRQQRTLCYCRQKQVFYRDEWSTKSVYWSKLTEQMISQTKQENTTKTIIKLKLFSVYHNAGFKFLKGIPWKCNILI